MKTIQNVVWIAACLSTGWTASVAQEKHSSVLLPVLISYFAGALGESMRKRKGEA